MDPERAAAEALRWIDVVKEGDAFWTRAEMPDLALPVLFRLGIARDMDKFQQARSDAIAEAVSDLAGRSGNRAQRRGAARRGKTELSVAQLFLTLPAAERERIEVEMLAEHVLRDWEGVAERASGAAVPCTPANKIRFLAFKPYRDLLADLADRVADYAEAELGNFESSPGPTSPSPG